MAKNENDEKTTTMAVSREYGDCIRAIAKQEGMTVLDFMDQLLESVLQNGVEVEVKVKKVKLKPSKVTHD